MGLFPVFLIMAVVFANRYFFGAFVKAISRGRFDQVDPSYTPTVSVIIPLYNEGKSIYDTILSIRKQDYPEDLLEIVVVDDCSTDDSHAWALRAAEVCSNVTVIRNPRNAGKRRGIINATRGSKAEIIVSVDSDVVVRQDAIRLLVSRFTRPSIAAVGGRIRVSNPNDNWLTQMQTVKYFLGYECLKNLERTFHSVMCLSGCLTAYRRSVLIELEPILVNRNIIGMAIKYGEDRFLTRQIVKAGYETLLTLEAICYTKVPSRLEDYFLQQLRWRRSNLVDFLGGVSHVWKLNPLVAVHYLSLCCLLLAYPVVVFENLYEQRFWLLGVLHLLALGGFGVFYRIKTRSLPAAERVPAYSFLAMAAVMPVTYLVITPLAAFTLDSGSWETRGSVQQNVKQQSGRVAPLREPVVARGAARSLDQKFWRST